MTKPALLYISISIIFVVIGTVGLVLLSLIYKEITYLSDFLRSRLF